MYYIIQDLSMSVHWVDHNKATARDVMDMTSSIETNTEYTSAWQDQQDQDSWYESIVPILLEFWYEWMPLHLLSSAAISVCQET